MANKNQGRLAEDMKREVVSVIHTMKDPRLQSGLLTVMRVEVTPDLDVAKVHVSVLGGEGAAKEAVDALNRGAGYVRTEISRRMHIRKSPRFVFVADDGAAYAAHINQLLAGLQEDGAGGTKKERDDE